MERTRIVNLSSRIGEKVLIAGWMHNFRRLAKFGFLLLRDVSGIAQILVEEKDQLDALGAIQTESVLQVEGLVVAEKNAASGYEIHAPVITIVSPVTAVAPFPINKAVFNVGLDTFLDNAPFGLRHPDRRAIFALSAALLAAFRDHLNSNGFTEVSTPKIVASATESGANVFALDYFGRKAFLAQSPQFYKQIMVGVFERVYEVGPVFRAEPHSTTRHLNEYVSLDVELGFIRDHFDIMTLLSALIRSMLRLLETQCKRELDQLKVKMPLAPEKFPSIYFPDAQKLIHERYGEDCSNEQDLSPQHERWLGEWALQEYQSDYLFVTGYPMAKRPFYTHSNPSDPRYSNGFDLLFRGVELVTGGQRLHRYEDYVQALTQRGLPVEPFEGYLEAFRFGMPPHGGFAIGSERFLMQLLAVSNLRETTLFPRDMNRLTP
ncbi:MAG TPA: aspartate--tRNA(Asn) ligase [Candidatus Angelobacter sp.]|nr:aspartate--tRNA(Asn) ligase [Candidatus Angelobacter sp.]